MRKMTVALATLAFGLVATVAVIAAEVKLENVKCFFNPKAAVKAETGVDYKEGKVYFCCGNCAKKFGGEKEKHAVKANHQLVLTNQYSQAACPLSGGKVNAEQSVEINGVKVGFCCGNCKGKVAEAKGDDQAALVFADEAFGKGFAKAK